MSFLPLKTPDLTIAQAVAGIPVLANFCAAFGIVHLNARQTASLKETLVYAGGLVLADAGIRVGRALGNTKR